MSLFVDIPINFVDISVGFNRDFSTTGNYFQYVGTSNGQNPTSWPQKTAALSGRPHYFSLCPAKAVSVYSALLDFDLSCENSVVILTGLSQESRSLKSVRALGCADYALDAVLCLLHLFLPVF